MAEWRIDGRQCEVDLDPSRVSTPALARTSRDAIVLANHDFFMLDATSWDEAEAALEEEEEFIQEYNAAADGFAVLSKFNDQRSETCNPNHNLDLGITAAVLCLRAMKAMPFVSCSGSFPFAPHHEEFPLVGFFASAKLLDKIIELARKNGLGLTNAERGPRSSMPTLFRKWSRLPGSF